MKSNSISKKIEELERIANYQLGLTKRSSFGIVDLHKNILRNRFYGGELTSQSPDILIPEKLEKLLFPKRYKIIFGGRNSTKTTTVCSIATEIIRSDGKQIMCCREVFNSIRESIHQSISNEIDRRNLRGTELDVNHIDIQSKISPGKAIFTRLKDNPENIKGKEGIDITLVDEAENISIMSWSVLRPTIRKEGSEIWILFNPRFDTDPTWTEFVAPFVDKMENGLYEDDQFLIIEINYQDNPWLTQVSIQDMERDKERDYDRYLWQWEGKFNEKSNVQVMHNKWEIKDFEVDPMNWEGPFFGADFGFSQDPATLIKMYIYNESLYISEEAWSKGVDPHDLPEFYDKVSDSRKYRIYADNSRSDTISYLKREGFNIRGASKASSSKEGNIQDGIAYLRSFKKIYIHPICVHTAEEFKLYSHKVDKLTEKILPSILDENNHCIDAIRYALVKKIQQKTSFWKV